MLRNSLLALALAGLIYAAPAVAQNNTPDPPAAGGEMHHGHGPMDPAKRTEMLTSKLNLTADQQTKVQGIFKSEQSQMESLRSDSSLSQQDRRSKMMDIHKASSDQVRTLLDPTQQKKWDEIQANRQQWQGHRHGGQSPGSEQ